MSLRIAVQSARTPRAREGKTVPIFEYECQGCGHVFEKLTLLRNLGESLPCPRCQAIQTRQLVSRFSSPSSEMGSFACAPSAFS
jgi:putative FmdB family regulatory protein